MLHFLALNDGTVRGWLRRLIFLSLVFCVGSGGGLGAGRNVRAAPLLGSLASDRAGRIGRLVVS